MSTLLTQISVIILTILLITGAEPSAQLWFSAYTVAAFFGAVIGIFLLFRDARGGHLAFCEVQRAETRYREVRRHGLFLIPGILGWAVILRAEKILIPFFFDSETLGVYVVSLIAFEVIALGLVAYSELVLRKWRKDHESYGSLRQPTVWSIAIGFALATIGHALTFVLISEVFEESYTEALDLLPPVLR